MKYLSACSGIEAASVAWEPIGWEPVSFAEIEAFPSAVLAHHWPDVPNIGNMEGLLDADAVRKNFDILVGGTPCQSFSVAGLRRGLADPRGNLMLTYGAIADAYKPRWIVWENVPGVLSSNGGRDFGTFLGMLADIGYGFAYRVLDAQNFGVPQRRRRVFVVGCLGDWRSAASVLFESESLQGDTPKGRKKRKRIAPTVTAGPSFSRTGNSRVEADAMIVQPYSVANCLTRRMHKGVNSSLDEGQTPVLAFPAELSGTQAASTEGISPTLSVTHTIGVTVQKTARRLTPVECERLQGFPDNHTRIPWRGKTPEDCPDGPRYKALGNSMAVPVMRWIGNRVQKTQEALWTIS